MNEWSSETPLWIVSIMGHLLCFWMGPTRVPGPSHCLRECPSERPPISGSSNECLGQHNVREGEKKEGQKSEFPRKSTTGFRKKNALLCLVATFSRTHDHYLCPCLEKLGSHTSVNWIFLLLQITLSKGGRVGGRESGRDGCSDGEGEQRERDGERKPERERARERERTT